MSVGRTVAREGAKKNLTSAEMSAASQSATNKAISNRVKPGSNFRRGKQNATGSDKGTVARRKRRNVKSAAKSQAQTAVKQN